MLPSASPLQDFLPAKFAGWLVQGRQSPAWWAWPKAPKLIKMSDMDEDVYDEEEDYDLVSDSSTVSR